jgi:predicted nucleic acid-binding protein
MKKYLFDTYVYSLIFSEDIPDKWVRYWKEARYGTKKLIIFEMLISEIFYKNSKKYGFKAIREKLEWIKYLPASEIVNINNSDAFQAAEYMVSLRRFGISLTDSYILAIARKHHARIVTTDGELKKLGCISA